VSTSAIAIGCWPLVCGRSGAAIADTISMIPRKHLTILDALNTVFFDTIKINLKFEFSIVYIVKMAPIAKIEYFRVLPRVSTLYTTYSQYSFDLTTR
jgi:hypothetical protein